MDVDDLRVLDAVARNGSMNRAATELNTVQSNITTRIRLLEEELGIRLFVRHSRGVELSEAGLRLLPYATRVRQLLQEASLAVREDGVPKGKLRLGAMETTAGLLLSPVLAAYAQSYPEVGLTVITGTTSCLTSQVIEHHIDGAFVAGPVNHTDLSEEVVLRDELVLVTPRSVSTIDALTAIEDLKIVVFRQGCSYRRRLEEILNGMGLQYQPVEIASLDAIIAFVTAGVGLTLLPKGAVTRAWKSGQIAIHELPSSQARVDTVFIRRHDRYPTSALNEFLTMIRKIALSQARDRTKCIP